MRDQRSNVREAVWWMPQNSTATLALGNFSDTETTATLQFSDGETKEVRIAPFATELVRRVADARVGHHQSNAESVKITTSGATQGSLIATGLVSSVDGSFTSGIRFYDPLNTVQPNLFATDFRLKHVVPHLLLKNTGETAVSARPRFRPAGEKTETQWSCPPSISRRAKLSKRI